MYLLKFINIEQVNELRRKMSEQEKVALEQNRIISEQAIKLTKQEGKLAEVSELV